MAKKFIVFVCLLGLGAAAPSALAADEPQTTQSEKAIESVRGLHVFHFGTRKSPLDELGLQPIQTPPWEAEFTLTPQHPAVVTGNQNDWPPGSLSAFGAAQWYSQGYQGWWTGQITLSDPSANLWLLLIAEGGKTYMIDERVSATGTGQFTITGPDGTTTTFPVVAGPNVQCSEPQHLKVLYQPEQGGPVNFETQFASATPNSGIFCSVAVSVRK